MSANCQNEPEIFEFQASCKRLIFGSKYTGCLGGLVVLVRYCTELILPYCVPFRQMTAGGRGDDSKQNGKERSVAVGAHTV